MILLLLLRYLYPANGAGHAGDGGCRRDRRLSGGLMTMMRMVSGLLLLLLLVVVFDLVVHMLSPLLDGRRIIVRSKARD
jgi:hypothetical protein